MAAMRAEAREAARHLTCHSGSTTIHQILNLEGEGTFIVLGGMLESVPRSGDRVLTPAVSTTAAVSGATPPGPLRARLATRGGSPRIGSCAPSNLQGAQRSTPQASTSDPGSMAATLCASSSTQSGPDGTPGKCPRSTSTSCSPSSPAMSTSGTPHLTWAFVTPWIA